MFGLSLLLALAFKLGGASGPLSVTLDFLIPAIALKETVEFRCNGGRAWRTWRSRGSVPRALWSYLPAEIRGWLTCLGRVLKASLKRPLDRSPPVRSDQWLGYLRRSGYGSLMPLLLFSSAMDIPLAHLLLHGSHLDDRTKLTLHIGLVALHVLAFLVLLGDRRLIDADGGSHRLMPDELQLTIGARARGRLRWSDVEGVDILTNAPGKVSFPKAIRAVTPMDKPNLRLRVRPNAAGELTLLGEDMPWPSELYLYVDEPQAVLRALEHFGARSRTHPAMDPA